MKILTLFAYPPEPDGLSQQGWLLHKGFLENGYDAMPCHLEGGLQKEWLYKSFKPDVVVGVGYWGNAPNLILHPEKHGMLAVPWLLSDGWVANYHDIFNRMPLVFVTSNWVKEMYKRDGVDTRNMEVIPVGCDPGQFRPMNNDDGVKKVREMLGVKDNEKMILTVGGDVTSKGAQEMFKALAKIGNKFDNWKYVCKTWPSDVARGHNVEETKLINELGLDKDKIIFMEGCFSREFMPFLLNAADIYAAPSRIEGFGMIQVEAMLCGKPVISIDAMGCKDTIVHGKTGYLAKVAEEVKLMEEWVYPWMGFEKRMQIQFSQPKTFALKADVDELAEYTHRLLADDSLRERLGKQAREHAVEKFYYKTVSKNMVDSIKKKFNLA